MGFLEEGVMESFRIPVKAVSEKERGRGRESVCPCPYLHLISDVSLDPQVHPWEKNALLPEGHFPSVLTTR